MTPSKQAKAYGLKSLMEASRISGAPHRTLIRWCDTKPLLFKAVCLGCIEMNKERLND